MSTIAYKANGKDYVFRSDLQIVNLLAVETCLIEEIKRNMHTHGIEGVMHDVIIQDDNGLIACAKGFENNSLCLKIVKCNNETH